MEGTELHHIVEQSQAKPERSGFDVRQINSSDNMTRIDRDVHREISKRYSGLVLGSGETLRNDLNGEPWEDQFRLGSRMLDEEFRRQRGDID